MPNSGLGRYGRKRGLKENDLGFRILFESAPLGIIIYDRKGRILEVNNYLLDILGSPSLEATKKINLFEFENLKESGISDAMRNTLEDGKPQKIETFYFSKWGRELYLQIIAFTLASDNESTKKGIALIQDLTLQKKSEYNLLESSESALSLNT